MLLGHEGQDSPPSSNAMTHRQTTASLTDMFLSVPLEQKEMPFYYLGKCARLVCVC